MIALAPSSFPLQTINSNHRGSDFGVVCFEKSEEQMSVDECLTLLKHSGWTTVQPVPSSRADMQKFLVSRKK